MNFSPFSPCAGPARFDRFGRPLSRRQIVSGLAQGLGGIALGQLLRAESAKAATEASGMPISPAGVGGLPGLPHFAPKAKRIIHLFMSGGPSHLDTFDFKPYLAKHSGEELPDSYRKNGRLPGMAGTQAVCQLKESLYPFQQRGNSGIWMSDILPNLSKVADDLCVIRSAYTDSVNHDPAITMMQTGSGLAGRPSAGAWIEYGLGRANDDLPAFIVMVSKRGVDQPLSAKLWGNGFLPAQFQGTQFRPSDEPVLYLKSPPGINREADRRTVDLLSRLHGVRPTSDADPLAARVDSHLAQYEMAFRMQRSVPEATDLSAEPDHIFDLYGPDARKPGSFASNCIQARRLAERGVRFIQLFHPGWDHHASIRDRFPEIALEIDQPCAALIQDLKQRDMLKDTLVIWSGEFGRTPYSQGRSNSESNRTFGRDHHHRCFSLWMAGGGIKPGVTWGESCDLGYDVAADGVHVHDLHATMLHLLGIDHERLTYRYQGRDFRLTDTEGKVVEGILA
ncbi:MAG: DUF1501 domain-containing protein [Verrucomicrobiae bacterium]|nr:DUF1501 domain-containing protein [Verrucomicrobiae bacterium]